MVNYTYVCTQGNKHPQERLGSNQGDTTRGHSGQADGDTENYMLIQLKTMG